MAFKSMTFTTRIGGKTGKFTEIKRAANRHKEAIDTVVNEARELASDSLRKIEGIQDPDLRRSARR